MSNDYLFTWKPGHWPYSELKRLVATFQAGRSAVEPWRCQAHRKIRIGDKAYLVKLGEAPRGIFGVGTISGMPYKNHKASEGENLWLVPITFDLLVDPTKSLLMPESNLMKLDAPRHRWHPQGSGITLEADAARDIDRFVTRKKYPNEPAQKISQTASAVEEDVRAVIPAEHLLDVLGMLAHSIRIANQFTPEKWGIHISRKNIMLKVGFVEVLQFHTDLFHQLVRNDLVSRKARSVWHDNFDAAPYKNAPACDTFDADLSISKKAYELLLPAHEAAIEIAARSPIHTTTKNDHSPSLVNFISRMVKIPLPQPAYVGPSEQTFLYPDETQDHKTFLEGAAISVLVNRYERDRAAINKCIEHHGADCTACGISFGHHYGPGMSGFIHVHHLAPLGDIRGQRSVDPIHDLRPVCPNCHAVIHSSNPPLTVDQVRSLIERNGKI
jgi:hypothetical protein